MTGMNASKHMAILLAAGSGRRMQGTVEDKLTARLNNIPVFNHSLRSFIESGIIDGIIVVYRDTTQQAELLKCIQLVDFSGIPLTWVMGGTERQHSVRHALDSITDCEYVYIHDSARPLVSIDSLRAVRSAVETDAAAILAHPVVDTIKRISSPNELKQVSLEDLDRSRLWAMETPQAFRFDLISEAYQKIDSEGIQVTDDAACVAHIGVHPTLVPNMHPNPKITNPSDLAYAEWLLKSDAAAVRNPSS